MEEALYDTSVLIDFFKRGIRELRGYTTVLNVVEFPSLLKMRGLRVIYPNARDFDVTVVISLNLYRLGKPVPAVDVVVASVAINRGLVLKTKDKHFKFINEVEDKLMLDIV